MGPPACAERELSHISEGWGSRHGCWRLSRTASLEGVHMQGLPVPYLHSYACRATGPGAPTLSPNFIISLPNHLNIERPTWLPTLQKPVQHENIGLRVQTSLISRWPSSRPGPACPPGVGRGHVCKASPSVARGILTWVVGEELVKDGGSQAAQSSVCTTVPPLLSVVTLDRSLGPSGPQFF